MTGEEEASLDQMVAEAEAFMAAGNADAAMTAARRALGHDPHHRDALAMIARCHFVGARLREAETAARELLATHPDDSAGHKFLSLAAHDLGKKKVARKEAQAAVELDPDEASNHLALALARELGNDFRGAEEAYRQALKLVPDYVVGKTRYANFLMARGRLEEARALTKEAGEHAPDNANVIVLRGSLALRDGHIDEAFDNALWALSLDATDHGALHLMAQVKMRRNPILGLWWRYAVAMGRYSFGKQVLILIALYFGWRILFVVAVVHLPQPLPVLVLVAWFGFCILTWVGPSILRRMVKRELKRVQLRKF